MNELSGKMDVMDVISRAEVLYYVFQDRIVRAAQQKLEIKIEKRFVSEDTVESAVGDESFVLINPEQISDLPSESLKLTNEEIMELVALTEHESETSDF